MRIEGARARPCCALGDSVRIAAIDERLTGPFADLFEACQSQCYCRWWQFEGSKNEWLDRCFNTPLRNRDEQLSLVREHAPESKGLMALEGDLALGWMKLVPRAQMRKLFRQGPYRRLTPAVDNATWSIGCFLVRPEYRRTGIARALVLACDAFVEQWGGQAIEAYPRRADHRLHDEEAWMGTADLFESCGFREVAGEGPYPVFRKHLDPGKG